MNKTGATTMPATRVWQVKKLLSITKRSRRLDEIYFAQRQINLGDAALVDKATVSKNYGGLSLYRDMRLKSHYLAAQQRFKYVIGQLSVQRKQKIVLFELSHRNCGKLALSECTCDSEHPFNSITNPKNIIISEQRL